MFDDGGGNTPPFFFNGLQSTNIVAGAIDWVAKSVGRGVMSAVRAFKAILRSAIQTLDRRALGFAALVDLFQRLYAVGRGRFSREMRAVTLGRAAFHAGLSHLHSNPGLRRAVHRLEKGLLMRPRHDVFAADYIEQAVNDYARAVRTPGFDRDELRWTHDVLAQYFDVVENTPAISRARTCFESIVPFPTSNESGVSTHAPFPERARVQTRVTFEDFLLLCRRRRSVRWFNGQAVPEALIRQALEAALQAPSACNRQPFFFRYFDNRTDAARIASIAMGTVGYSEQIPALLVLLGDWSCFEDERDRHLPYIDGALAAMQLMLALETLGLASCPINWPDVESLERRMTQALELPPYVRPIMLIAVGYPDPEGGVAYSAKKTVNAMLKRNG